MISSSRISYGRFGSQHTAGNPELNMVFYGNWDTGDRRKIHENIQRALGGAFNDRSTLDAISKRSGFDPDTINFIEIDFINWGGIQLVYRVDLALPDRTVRLAALVSQPGRLGMMSIWEEFMNLQQLARNGSTYVIEPLAYFCPPLSDTSEHELYISPFIENVRCVYSSRFDKRWGVFEPDPKYDQRVQTQLDFVPFLAEARLAVLSSMIALLVAHYDAALGRGLAKTRFSGDDFMLTQGFKHDNPATVLPNLKLIAARGWVEAPLDNYLDILRREFLIGTHYDDPEVRQRKFIVNHKCSSPLTAQEIEAGISLGLSLRP